jgi:hypothetical protein
MKVEICDSLARAREAFPNLTPVPPLPLLDWQIRIFRLRHCADEGVEAAGIDDLLPHLAKLSIHSFRVAPAKLRYAVHAQQFKIFQHRGTDSIPNL